MEQITVVIPSSPIRAHPSTEMLEQTISDIRGHLPNSDIIIGLDGVREEQEYLREQYNEYKDKVLYMALHEWHNVVPIIYEVHKHQSGMMWDWMDFIKTDLVLYVEHDTPLTPDRAIDWQRCVDFIYEGHANTIRFHFENVIPDEHKNLMIGGESWFTKTYQWSQRPLLTTKLYIDYMLDRSFSTEETKACFIEDIWHGIVANDYLEDGMLGWYKHRLWIYTPPGKQGIQRSYNLDGRGDEQKYKQSFEDGYS